MNSLAIRVSKLLRSSPISPLAVSAEKGSRLWFWTGPIDEGVEEDLEENISETLEIQPHGVDPRKGWGFRGVHRVVQPENMSVLIVTSLGDIVIDLYSNKFPLTCKNFLKLCKIKYYNGCHKYNGYKSIELENLIAGAMMSSIYDEKIEEDGFLYVTYSGVWIVN